VANYTSFIWLIEICLEYKLTFPKDKCLTCLHVTMITDYWFKYIVSGSTMVEHSPRDSKVGGLSPATTARIGGEFEENKVLSLELRQVYTQNPNFNFNRSFLTFSNNCGQLL